MQTMKLYSISSIIRDFKGHKGVPFDWFFHGIDDPDYRRSIARYEGSIVDYWSLCRTDRGPKEDALEIEDAASVSDPTH